jgi:outer membrane biosynthesis protein TonB
VKDVVILDSEPKGLWDRNTIRAVSNWRFQPAMKDGKPSRSSGSRRDTPSSWSADAASRGRKMAARARAPAWLLPPVGAGRAEDAAAPARAKPAAEQAKPAAEEPENEAEEERKDAEDEKKRAAEEKGAKKWRAKTPKDAKEAEMAMQRTMGRRTTRFITKASQLFATRSTTSRTSARAAEPEAPQPYERAMVYKYQAYNAYGKEQVPARSSCCARRSPRRSSPSRTRRTSCSRSPRCRWARTTSRRRSRRSRSGSRWRRSRAPRLLHDGDRLLPAAQPR